MRVLVDGTWGFASHVELTPERAVATAERAVGVARALAPLARERVDRAPEPVYAGVEWCADYLVDPLAVPTGDKVALLADRSRRLLAAPGVHHVEAGLAVVRENKFYADLAGTSTLQQRVRTAPSLTATTVDHDGGGFETMSSLAPPAARGFEYLTGTGWDWDDELDRLPEWLAEKAVAPSVEPGRYDLVIDPSNLWLTIHESVGHATEYDRAIGYEAAYAGTSFATPDLLGTLRYGSPLMHVTGDRTVPHGLATIGYDDDGVATGEWDLVRDGILVGYQLDRTFAPRLGLARSNGCAFADSPHRVPLQRMANVSLQPDACRRPVDGRPDRRGGRRDLRRRGPVVVDRHAAGELPVHRPALLPHPRRSARRAAPRRRLPGADHGVLGRARRARWPVDVAVVRRDELRQGATRAERRGRPRLPVGTVPPGQCPQHPCGRLVP